MDQGKRPDARKRLRRRASDLGRIFAEAATMHGLSPRETEVGAMVFGGRTNEGIARLLDISVSAVKKHRDRAFRKFGARRVVEFLHAVHLSGK